uniref:Uncharacterized protein n=1 Tax=Schizaphis graminum TaxID=13262 RepID=A0A2S2NM09_SCHGA
MTSVCVSVCVCVCMCVCERESVRAAVSTARIGMSGMIGIEFFKNAFSPGTVRQRWCRAGDSWPARLLVANTRDITAAADRGEVTTVLPRASPPAENRSTARAYTIILLLFFFFYTILLWSSVNVVAKNINKKLAPHIVRYL